ncbi:MAG: tRNA guanosine(34) transglycosylase Tgt [Chloroflexota bacterium]
MVRTNFNLIKSDGEARAGELITPHGIVPTPVFLPVGTQASVKTLTPDEVREIGFRIILANTYHLYLRPGLKVIEKMGGLGKFTGWDGAILTDSGGYQIFSLTPLRKLDDEGVTFRSHLDGSEHLITPELAIKYQEIIGADIIMVLDECSPTDASYDRLERAAVRTFEWAKKCLGAKKRDDQALYAIVQGGLFPELRKRSAEELTHLDFDGYAVGGLSLGEPKEKTWEIVSQTTSWLPRDKARYLMGMGSPEDLVEGIARGTDIFDCALPTRVARNGALFTSGGRRNIKNAVFREIEGPVEPGCQCYTCRNFSAGYLHHLFMSNELLSYRLATIHNLSFVYNLTLRAREAILNGTFASFRKSFRADYVPTDEEIRVSQKKKWLATWHGERDD